MAPRPRGRGVYKRGRTRPHRLHIALSDEERALLESSVTQDGEHLAAWARDQLISRSFHLRRHRGPNPIQY
ncbi:MAG: hypothetical protein K0Q52_140 [Microbacterium sp.]|jgi:hypothetical protein|nr:hypothetical protein [Microbacterium sp.]